MIENFWWKWEKKVLGLIRIIRKGFFEKVILEFILIKIQVVILRFEERVFKNLKNISIKVLGFINNKLILYLKDKIESQYNSMINWGRGDRLEYDVIREVVKDWVIRCFVGYDNEFVI